MRKYDKLLLLVTGLLVILGALMIYSCTSVGTGFYYFKRHLFTILIGFSVMLLAYKLKPSFLKNNAIPLLVFSFVLLILVFLPGIGVSSGGARRWIQLWPSTFQPSELVKLAMVIFLARYMSLPEYRTDSIASFAKPILIMAVFQAAILKQPDFGAAVSLAVLTVSMLFLSGIKLRFLASLTVFAVPVVIKLAMEPYRLRRITSFLNPWDDAQGSGFQLVQSFIALGSGGLTGVGIGSSRQKLAYLPESHTDFIFSIIGEEFGFIGASVVLVLFLFLFIKGISIANRSEDSFIRYLAIGLSLMISFQALINFAVATGLVPTKGLPLPFISYGGSSLLVNMAAVGMLLNISKGEQTDDVYAEKGLLMKKKASRRIIEDKRRSGGTGRILPRQTPGSAVMR
jgi:cell division protein FtsW